MKSYVCLFFAAVGLGIAISAQAQVPAPKPPHNQLECTACHKAGTQQKPTTGDCLACHGSYEAVATKTAGLNPRFNPHASHREKENCTDCHSIHGKSVFICNDCHGFTGKGTQIK